MPASFHGYEVEEQIGAGGMSTVFRGIHKNLGYKVAIKILHPALSMDQHFIARFEREARAASSLASSNIARVIDYGEEAGVYFIVMEYVAGKDLGQIFRELQAGGKKPVPFPVEITLLLLEDAAYGLQKAHEQNIIHRDIKPSNMLLSYDGEVKLVDFGLARDVRLAPGELTHTGMVIGTPSYMSPEQAAGGKKIDARSDIFSLGVMAYQFLTGEKPFRGETASAIQETIIKGAPAPLTSERCPLLTPEINTFVTRCLEKDPDKRHATMTRVVEALGSCLESIDDSGDLIRRRRRLLTSFLSNPQDLATELLQRAISLHLKRALLFKSMGREKLGDAERELRRVLCLDPGNKKAIAALTELGHPDETVVRPLVRDARPGGVIPDPTKIVEPEQHLSGPPPPPQPALEAQPAKSKRGPLPRRMVLYLALCVITLGLVGIILRGGGWLSGRDVTAESQFVHGSPATSEASASDKTAHSDVDQAVSPALDSPLANDSSEIPSSATKPAPELVPEPSLEPAPPSSPPTGYLALDLPERLDIYLNDQRAGSGTGVTTLKVEPNRVHRVEVRNRAAFARDGLGSFTVAPGDTHRARQVQLAYGRLTLKANADVTIRVDGALLAESVKEINEKRIGAGDHELSITAPIGYRIELAFYRNADGGRVALVATGGGSRTPKYAINVPLGGDVVLGVLVKEVQ